MTPWSHAPRQNGCEALPPGCRSLTAENGIAGFPNYGLVARHRSVKNWARGPNLRLANSTRRRFRSPNAIVGARWRGLWRYVSTISRRRVGTGQRSRWMASFPLVVGAHVKADVVGTELLAILWHTRLCNSRCCLASCLRKSIERQQVRKALKLPSLCCSTHSKLLLLCVPTMAVHIPVRPSHRHSQVVPIESYCSVRTSP